MFKQLMKRSMLALTLLAVSLFASACSTTAKEQALTGDQMHERHDMGMSSQVSDS